MNSQCTHWVYCPSPPVPTPPRREQTPQPTTRRSKRSKKVPRREGNVYGETRHPVEILQGKEKEWRHIEGSVPGASRMPPETSAPEPGPSQPPQPRSPTPSECHRAIFRRYFTLVFLFHSSHSVNCSHLFSLLSLCF